MLPLFPAGPSRKGMFLERAALWWSRRGASPMSRGCLVSLVGLLAGTSLVLGQSTVPPPAVHQGEEVPAPHSSVIDTLESCLCGGADDDRGPAVLIADADYVLWFIPRTRT